MESIIFGAGLRGRCLRRGLEKYYGIHIHTIFDNDEGKWGKKIDDAVICPPQNLTGIEIERIFLCIENPVYCGAVETQLINLGVPKEKIVDMGTTSEYKEALMENNPVRKNWIKAFSEYTKEAGISGSVAECGVFRGETAMFINKYWPDRTLHLFDTFEGFSDEDVVYDLNTFSVYKTNADALSYPFKVGTSDSMIEIVKNRMYYPDNSKIHKGHFPESAGNIEDSFCFVSLDMDLYIPQLEGLRYFWDKMEPGGIILLHDYYSPGYPGTKKAIADFEKELGDMLLKFPIGDYRSIAVIKR